MEVLWSPWRYDYIKSGSGEEGADSTSCVFCSLLDDPRSDESKFIVHRGRLNFVVLNIYPYISGHLLIVPYEHVADLDAAEKATTDEMMDLAKRCQSILRLVYNPQGFNLGINLGRAAGAGIAGHVHMHVLPRWQGDSNFMSSIGGTRVIPEDLATTYTKLRAHFEADA